MVTLCGLLIYRSLGRWLTDNQSLGPVPLEGDKGYENLDQIKSLDFIFSGKIPIGESFNLPTPFLFLLILGVATAVFLRKTIWGRYLYALGNNEEGARYSGIDTDKRRRRICALLLFSRGCYFVAFELDSVQLQRPGVL